MSEIYQAPQSELTDAPQHFDNGSIERAIQGEYSLQVGTVISEAWNRVSGTKWKFQLALIIYFILYIGISLALRFIFHSIGYDAELPVDLQEMPEQVKVLMASTAIESILLPVLSAPLWVGVGMMGIKRAVDGTVTSKDVLSYYRYFFPLAITFVIMYVLMILGFVLLVIPGIYLAVAYSMSLYLVVDKKLSPWQALETSRKAVTKRWFALFGLYVVLSIFNLIGAIPLGIGLIWTIPLFMIAFGIAYRNMFGVEPETQAS